LQAHEPTPAHSDAEKIEANVKDDALAVTLPKKPAAPEKKIDVKAAA
jgi:HSP20 family molecular chaperone IbpA